MGREEPSISLSSTFAQELADGKRMYQAYCSGCHGLSGKGDGPAAKTLPVKPADHTRIEMNKYTDQYLVEVISTGGASVGRFSNAGAGRSPQGTTGQEDRGLRARLVQR
jgi:hypothetical protein